MPHPLLQRLYIVDVICILNEGGLEIAIVFDPQPLRDEGREYGIQNGCYDVINMLAFHPMVPFVNSLKGIVSKEVESLTLMNSSYLSIIILFLMEIGGTRERCQGDE